MILFIVEGSLNSNKIFRRSDPCWSSRFSVLPDKLKLELQQLED